MGSISRNWKALSGENNWEGLLDPLDIDLRRYIVHYGERAEAIGDAFNTNTDSKAYRFSLYPMKDFFSKVCLEKGNPFKYEVTSFIYAKSEHTIFDWVLDSETSWIAYVAVATDEGKTALGRRDILISWRGTMTKVEGDIDIEITKTDASDILGNQNNIIPLVHRGFHSIYTTNDSKNIYSKSSSRDQVIREVKKLVEKYKNEEVSITVTGHSMGSAVATLNAMDIVANKYNIPASQPDKAFPVTAFLFASPIVGDKGFAEVFNELQVNDKLRILRITNAHDLVPNIIPESFVHVGEVLPIDTTLSPYLKKYDDNDLNGYSMAHQIEVYLHGVAGTQNGGKEFNLSIYRDIKLVNKGATPFLKDDSVPVNWWTYIQKFNAMTQLDDANWVLDDYMPDPPEDD